MKFISLILLLLISTSAQAQNWTPVQLEVLDQLETCYDINRDANLQGDPASFLADCTTPEGRWWWAPSSVPGGSKEFKRVTEKRLGSWDTKRWDWVALRPIHVDIIDDIALLYLAPVFVNEDVKDNTSYIEQHRLHVLRKIDGKWKSVGGMGTPVATN